MHIYRSLLLLLLITIIIITIKFAYKLIYIDTYYTFFFDSNDEEMVGDDLGESKHKPIAIKKEEREKKKGKNEEKEKKH